MSTDIKMENVEQLVQRFRKLENGIRRTVAMSASRAAANVLRDSLKQAAQVYDDPSTPNNMAKNAAVRFASRLSRRGDNITMRVGFMGGAKTAVENNANPGRDTYYWRFLNMGTKKKWGGVRIQGRRFVEGSAIRAQSRAIQVFIERFEKRLRTFGL